MTPPNFFIVGAAKSGTTSLYHYLRQHPRVFLPAVKEPSHFMDWEGGVRSFEDYLSLFSKARDAMAVGEASTGYLYEPQAPLRIKQCFPEARIVMILRNPVDMCFALWRHMRRLGKRGESLPFEAALDKERSRMSDGRFRAACTRSWHANFYYFHRALYHRQVERYLETFGKDRVLVLFFEHFKSRPLETCTSLFRFLGVAQDFKPDIARHNVGIEFRHRGLQKALTDLHPFLEKLGNSMPSNLLRSVEEWLRTLNVKPAPRMNPSTKERLTEAYAPDVKLLGKLLERDLTPWLRGI